MFKTGDVVSIKRYQGVLEDNLIGRITFISVLVPTPYRNIWVITLKSKTGMWLNISEIRELNDIESGIYLCMKLAGEV